MKVQCPNCGGTISVNGLGRRPLNMPVKNVCDALRDSATVTETAKKLGCSRPYVYKVLKAGGMTAKDVINSKGLATKDTRLLHKGGFND